MHFPSPCSLILPPSELMGGMSFKANLSGCFFPVKNPSILLVSTSRAVVGTGQITVGVWGGWLNQLQARMGTKWGRG